MDGWLVSFWKVVGVLLGTQGLGFVLLSSPGHHPVPGPYLWQKPVAWLFLPSAATLLSDALASHPPFLGFKPWTSSLPTCQALPVPRVSSDDRLEWCGRGPCCLGQGAGAAFCLPGTVGEPCLVPLVDNIPTVPWASLCVPPSHPCCLGGRCRVPGFFPITAGAIGKPVWPVPGQLC